MYNGTMPVAERTKHAWNNMKLQLFGSDLQADVHGAESKFSLPWEYLDYGRPGIHIWRITGFCAVHWPHELYGHFYEQHAYLVLNVQSDYVSDQLQRHIHFWVGPYASQEDYGTAAYKAGELDERLNFEGIVHREIQGRESELFRSYFTPIVYGQRSYKESYWYSKHHGTTHQAKLYRFYKPDPRRSNYAAKEVLPDYGKLDPAYIFILDLGHQIFQWNGSLVKNDDIMQAIKHVETLKANRGIDVKVDMIDERDGHDGSHRFYTYMTRRQSAVMAEDSSDSSDSDGEEVSYRSLKRGQSKNATPTRQLVRVILERGKTAFVVIRNGKLRMSDLSKQTTCIYTNGKECFVWISIKAAIDDKKLGLEYAHEYLKNTKRPMLPVAVLREGQHYAAFEKELST